MAFARYLGCSIRLCFLAGYLHQVLSPTPLTASDPVASQQSQGPDPESKTASATPREIWLRKITFNSKDAPLKDVLQQIANAAELNLDLDIDAFELAKVDLDRLQSISLDAVELHEILRHLLHRQTRLFTSFESRIRGNTLFISTALANRTRLGQALPDWLKSAFRDNQVFLEADDDQQVLSLSSGKLTDELLAHLCSLKKLRELTIYGTDDITPIGMAGLADIPALEAFTLSHTDSNAERDIADVALHSLAGSKTLRSLELVETGVTDAGIRCLEGMSQLSSLKIYQEGRLTDAALSAIAKIKRLRHLDLTSHVGTRLGRMSFSLVATKRLALLKELEHLDLSGHPFAPDMFRFPRLKSLSISGSELDENIAQGIANCEELRRLDLSFYQVTDRAFLRLQALASLTELNLRCRNVTDDAISHLRPMPKLESVHLRTYGLTDKSLQHFSEMNSLSALNLNWATNRFSAAGLQQLASLHNLRTLHLRVIPYHESFVNHITEPDDSSPVSLELPVALPTTIIQSEWERKRTPIDLDTLAKGLSNTRIIASMDEMNMEK